jgi:hydroxymethylbilane synthase
VRTELLVIRTQGDVDTETPLPEIGGKGAFTERLEQALRDGGIDLAVHSLKDLPIEPSNGLRVGAIFGREDARDVLVSRNGATLAGLPPGAAVGTSSTRRAAQLRAARPDLDVRPIRGNVETRIAKVDAGICEATVLAAAGILRLGLAARISEYLAPETFLPAPGQGALAVQCREDDDEVCVLLAPIDDPLLRAATDAERAFLRGLGGGCSMPVAALAEADGTQALVLRGFVGAANGTRAIRVRAGGALADAQALGERLAQEALGKGAAALLADSESPSTTGQESDRP